MILCFQTFLRHVLYTYFGYYLHALDMCYTWLTPAIHFRCCASRAHSMFYLWLAHVRLAAYRGMVKQFRSTATWHCLVSTNFRIYWLKNYVTQGPNGCPRSWPLTVMTSISSTFQSWPKTVNFKDVQFNRLKRMPWVLFQGIVLRSS